MIPVNELRIGNIVASDCKHFLSELDNTIIKVASIVKDEKYKSGYYVLDNDGTATDVEYLKPIDVTPERLNMCGFEKDGRDYCLGSNWECDFQLREANGVFRMLDPSESQCFGPEIKYLHRLQNIYVEMEGKELKMNI